MSFYSSGDIIIYPVKSLAGISLNRWQVTEKCFQYDRKWLLIDNKGQCLTQRRLPKMALIKTALTKDQLILSASNQKDLILPLEPTTEDFIQAGSVCDNPYNARSVSSYADLWFSRFLAIDCQLVYLPDIDEEDETFNKPISLDTIDADLSEEGLSAVNLSELLDKNKRIAPRYIRDDISVALCETTQLSFGKEIFIDFVDLNDISSRGMSISSNYYLTIRKKIVLNLRFHSGMTFKIPATIVHRSDSLPPYQYGIKFDYDNHELSEHLLATQRTLLFK